MAGVTTQHRNAVQYGDRFGVIANGSCGRNVNC